MDIAQWLESTFKNIDNFGEYDNIKPLVTTFKELFLGFSDSDILEIFNNYVYEDILYND